MWNKLLKDIYYYRNNKNSITLLNETKVYYKHVQDAYRFDLYFGG